MSEIALVTGANKGIGKEIARQLASEGMVVFLGSRDRARGEAAALEVGAKAVVLDVTDEQTVQAAAKVVEAQEGRLDVLVNNAGIAIEWGTDALDVSVDQIRQTYEVNVLGVAAVTRAFLPLLRRSAKPRIVNLSSPLGSLTLLSDPDGMIAQHALLGYSSSKSALNSLTLLYANALRPEGIAVNAVSPGYVATDLNGHRGMLTVEQGARSPVQLALDRSGRTGTFSGESSLPW